MQTEYYLENLNERDNLEGLSIDRKIIQEGMCKVRSWEFVDYLRI